jgi:hypothetical protein
VLLLLVTIFAVLVPLFVGAHGGAARVTRLLLLPIPRRTLHFVEDVSGLMDPWMVFVLPGLLGYAGGLLAGGLARPEPWLHRFVAGGAIACAAAIGMAVVLASLSSLVAFLVSWLVRDRRRGEIFVLVFVVILSGLSIAPAFLSQRLQGEVDPLDPSRPAGSARSSWVMGDLPVWTVVLPSELYGAAVGAATDLPSTPPWLPLVVLFVEGGLLYALSGRVHRRLVESVEGGRVRRQRVMQGVAAVRIPGMWPGTSAVAIAQVRTSLRSVRGRLAVLLPGPLVSMLALTFRNIHDIESTDSVLASRGHLAFGAGIVFALYASQAFTMNQFGSDRSGLTREFLAPIRDVDLVRGKAVGCAVIVAAGALLSLVCALTVASGGSPLLWIATLAGGAAAFLILSPISALVSILLPVASDLSKTGTGGNPHSIAMLAGTVLVAVAVAPAALILAYSGPGMALVAMSIWLAVAAAIALPLLGVVAKTLRARRENLALVAQNR